MKRKKKCTICGKMVFGRGMSGHLRRHEREVAAGQRDPIPEQASPRHSYLIDEPTDPPATEEEVKKLADRVVTLEFRERLLQRRIRQYQTVVMDLTELLESSLEAS